jgi:hypothetical protein
MKRNSKRGLFPHPLSIWTELAFKTGEMMLASAQVIGHRTGRMAKAGPAPNARDRREFALMGHEKVEAARESSQAIATRLLNMNQRLSSRALGQLLASANAMMALAASRTAGQSAARQARLVHVIAQSATTLSQLSNSAAGVAHHGLKPIHSRAVKNAKRLGKR